MPSRHSLAVALLAVLVATAAPPAAVAPPGGLARVGQTEDVAPEQVLNGAFDAGSAGWSWYGLASAGATGGELCATVTGGLANPWDAGMFQDLPLTAGAAYTLSFRAHADVPVSIRATVQLGQAPYTPTLEQRMTLTGDRTTYTYRFTSTLDGTPGQLAFQIGGYSSTGTVCLDDVSLTGGAARQTGGSDTGPRVRVNQVGYLPDGPKRATVVTDATTPVAWRLRNAAGATVASGAGEPRGFDNASGRAVQTVDFSGFTTAGTGYTLVADGDTSYPFDISPRVYQALRADTMQYFYLQRSGIAIDGSLAGPAYARPAGHLGVAPNHGDTDVGCYGGGCGYRLDVRGGWYDAGDQGKYVASAGIAVYQLMSVVERAAVRAPGGGALADGALRVPERGNGVPDVLDEARWELEFLLRMQVPAGRPQAGMAHAKVHDRAWTGLPTRPDLDPQPRELYPPTTAATYDLAAVAAQCARVYAPYDQAFAARCLTVARTAYAAAVANPGWYADPRLDVGGGSYVDYDASDERYWAAGELYLTTGDGGYLSDLTASSWHTADVFDATGFGWLHTAALARLDLAAIPSRLPDRSRVRQSVSDAAERYLTIASGQGFGLPLPGNAGSYFWGSNSNVLNNLVVLATAYDLTGDQRYRTGALSGVDYIFGRNAVNRSYVAGWGDRSPQHTHHRWYGPELGSALPPPPPGMLVGGANAQADDPAALMLLSGCAPQACYVDDVRSYHTNESAINYQSALAWMAAFLDDQGSTGAPAAACRVQYTAHGSGNFTANVTVTNTGRTPLAGWTVAFVFPAAQRVQSLWQGQVRQSGPIVAVRNESFNGRLAAGATTSFGFAGTAPDGSNPAPTRFWVNGVGCDG